VADKVEVYTKT